LIKFYSVFSEPFPFQQTVLVYAQLMSQGSANPVPERITIKGNCVECGCPLGAEPAPFEGSKSKPLAPGNSSFQIELPDEAQHQRVARCKPCRLKHREKWETRRRQLPWLIALAAACVAYAVWLLW